jgi:hypothetical protein
MNLDSKYFESKILQTIKYPGEPLGTFQQFRDLLD